MVHSVRLGPGRVSDTFRGGRDDIQHRDAARGVGVSRPSDGRGGHRGPLASGGVLFKHIQRMAEARVQTRSGNYGHPLFPTI